MKTLTAFVGLLFVSLVSNTVADTTLLPQRVLYIGHRAEEFTPLFKKHFTKVESVARGQFTPAQAENFDVVVLDWPQSHIQLQGKSHDSWDDGVPLGKREEWNKPTVLLGSAGLNLAVAWKLKGGSGCTCLAPVAYGLKDHEIFKGPIPIDIKKTTTIPTVKQFAPELKSETMEVLPLIDVVKDYARAVEDNSPGWATHYYEFADVPEVEYFSGGINSQTPRSSALWRQGNLLHFGFEQSPAQLNETGKAMLINSIAYISRFTEDRPIDITPSVFAKSPMADSRKRAKAYFTNPEYKTEWATKVLSPSVLAVVDLKDRAAAGKWFTNNSAWLHPNAESLLEVDAEAKALGTPFDAADFIPKAIAALGEGKKSAGTLLNRYVNNGLAANADAQAWEKWWKENGPYVFYSELGCYQWYVDPLAKKRGVPTKELRGPARASASNKTS